MEKLEEKNVSRDKIVDYAFKFVLGSVVLLALANLAFNIFMVYHIVNK